MPHVVLKWDAESDGDPSHKPTAATVHRPADPEHEFLYRHKLAQQLMVESGRAEKGKQISPHFLCAHGQVSFSISMTLWMRWSDCTLSEVLKAIYCRWWALKRLSFSYCLRLGAHCRWESISICLRVQLRCSLRISILCYSWMIL